MAVIKDVVFAYVKIQQPALKYQSDSEYEFTVDCIVSEKEAKAFKKKFKKQPPKEVPTEDFEKIFKIAPPYPDQEEQFVIKLKKPAQFKNKQTGRMDPIPDKYRPRVLVPGDNGKLKDITFDTLVSNGSTGVVQMEVMDNSFGTFAKLKAIRVDNLIEYQQAGQDFDELGEVDSLAEAPERDTSQTCSDDDYDCPVEEPEFDTDDQDEY